MTCDPVKTTKIIIPRVSGEGGLGLEDIPWGTAYFDSGRFSNIYVKDDIYLKGDMFIWGEVNTVNSTVLIVQDTNIVIGDAGSGNNSDILADGGGFTLKGDTDKTILWRASNNSWNFSESVKISGSSVVDGDNYTVSDSYVGGNFNVTGNTSIDGASVVGGDNYTVSDSYVGGNFNVTGNTSIDGASVVGGDNYTVSNSYVGGNFYVTGNTSIDGNLLVNGESFVVEAEVVKVEDKNIEMGISSTGVSTDATADGGGISLHGDTLKTISWSNATDSWDVSEHLGVADGKYIFSDKLRARDTAGLSLEDSAGNGIFIEDGGDVGIGTNNPSVGLEINHTDALKIPKGTTVQRPTSNLADHKGYIRYNTTTDQFEGFGAGNAWGSLGGVIDVDQDTYVSAEDSAGADNDELKFFTSGDQRAVIKSNGNVGIGTTNPSANLHILGDNSVLGSQGFIKIANNVHGDAGLIGDSTALITNGSSNQLAIRGGSAGIIFGVGSTPRMILGSTGNVGIGTTSPGERLDVNGRIRIENSTTPTTTSNRLYAVGGNLFWNGEDVLHARDTIGEMEDTSIGTKSNGQLLIWNDTSSKWVNSTLTGGSAINVTNAAGGITISHSDTSTASSSSNSGRTYIQDIGIDGYGHVTSISTATETVVNTNTTYSAGTGLTLSGTTFNNAITNNNQLTNGAGYVTTDTTYSAGTALGLNGTTFNVSPDLIFATVPTIGTIMGKIEVGTTNGIRFFTWDGVVGNNETMRLTTGDDLHVAGDVLAFSTTLSDERLKDNVTEIKGALNKIETMRGVSYTWNKGSRKGQKDIGVIAQEVEQVIPEIVREHKFEVGEFEGDKNSYKTVDYEKLSAVLIEAVKELSAKVKTLEETVSKLS